MTETEKILAWFKTPGEDQDDTFDYIWEITEEDFDLGEVTSTAKDILTDKTYAGGYGHRNGVDESVCSQLGADPEEVDWDQVGAWLHHEFVSLQDW